VLGLVVLLTLVILNLPSRTTARLKLSISGLFLPLFGLAGSAHNVADQTSEALRPRGELLRENETLRRENQALKLQSFQAQAFEQENHRLRDLYGWQRQQRWKLKLARVVLREPSNWWRTVQIDLGERHGIKVDMPVLTTDGLAGRVSSVGLTRSQVVLLGDPNCKVPARVENDTRDTGVIGGGGPLDAGFVEMSYLSRNANLKPGQRVRTSGLGVIYPEGIPIGTIVDAQSVEYGFSTMARVKLAANLNSLEEVWVMTEK
jgi:rod shape-determining protein MreC